MILSLMRKKSTARVVFPGEPGHVDLNQPDTDPEEDEEDEQFEAESGDPLADFPDETEVRMRARYAYSWLLNSYRILTSFTRGSLPWIHSDWIVLPHIYGTCVFGRTSLCF
jgi:hypothetical protein